MLKNGGHRKNNDEPADDSPSPRGRSAVEPFQRSAAGDVVVPVAATTGVLTYAAMTALFPAAMAPEVAASLGIPAAVIGLQISLVYAGAMITSLIGGTLTQRFGACRATQLAVACIVAGAAVARLPAVAAFAVGSVLIGLGYGLTNPAASHLLMRVAPSNRRGVIFSIKQTGVPLGGVLAGAIAPVLALRWGWHGALAVPVVLGVLIALLLQTRRHSWDADRDRGARLTQSPLADLRLVWLDRPLRFLSLAGLCFASIQLCLSAFTVAFLVGDMHVGIIKAGLAMSAVQIAGVAGRVSWGWIGDAIRSGSIALFASTFVTIVGALATSQMSPAWPHVLMIVTLSAMGFSALGWNGIYLAEVARLAPRDLVARASGGSLFFTFSGVLMGPPAFAALHQLMGAYANAFAALAVVALVGLSLVVAARRSAKTAS